MLFSKARAWSASLASLALFAGLAALTGACSSPSGPDLTLSELSGNYGPVLVGDNIGLTAVFTSKIIDTHNRDGNGNEIYSSAASGNVQASLLSDLNPLVGHIWNAASISVGSTDLVLTQNPGETAPTQYSIALSQVSPGDGAPITYYHSETQLGQTVSDAVSSGCEALSNEYLALDVYNDRFDASIVERTAFNDISPVGGGTAVTCAQLFAQVQAELRSGTTSSKNQLFAVFVTNGVITVDQIAQLQELDVSASLSAAKGTTPVAAVSTRALQATGKFSFPSEGLKKIHEQIVNAVRR